MRKGAALAVLNAVDAKSLVLFVLCSWSACCFLPTARTRACARDERNWGCWRVSAGAGPHSSDSVLGELALVGLATGVVGAALAEILALVAAPGSAVVARVAGRPDRAWRSPASPALRPHMRRPAAVPSMPCTRFRAAGPPSPGSARVAGSHVRISCADPARLVSGALGLFIGVAAFAVLLAVQLAFQGQVVGTALGNLVSVQVRSVDLIAAVLALLLGAFSVADVLAVNLRDRAGEQAVLAATGWRPATLFRLAFTEGMVVGSSVRLPAEPLASGSPRSSQDRRSQWFPPPSWPR